MRREPRRTESRLRGWGQGSLDPGHIYGGGSRCTFLAPSENPGWESSPVVCRGGSSVLDVAGDYLTPQGGKETFITTEGGNLNWTELRGGVQA